MDEKLMAVGVGYNFAVVPAAEVAGISLKHSNAVRIDGKTLPLFKGATYEDSRMIDAILDQHTEHPIQDYLIQPVIMSGVLEMTVPGFQAERDAIMFGSYRFICEGKEIPFDFSGMSWDIHQERDKLVVSFETSHTSLNTDSFLDDYYEEDCVDIGLRLNDITAKLLSGVSSISEFMVLVELPGKELSIEDICRKGDFVIKSLAFSDDKYMYPVSSQVLDSFNCSLSRNVKKDLSAQISSAKEKIGSEKNPAVSKKTPER